MGDQVSSRKQQTADDTRLEVESSLTDTKDDNGKASEYPQTANTEVPTITMEVEVPAPGANEDQLAMYQQMADLFEERFETFVSKNLDYDSSFLTAGQIDAIYSGGPFDSATEANLYKLFTRIEDKNQRFYNLVFGTGDDLVGEKPAETAGDAGVYWFMVEWLLRHHAEA